MRLLSKKGHQPPPSFLFFINMPINQDELNNFTNLALDFVREFMDSQEHTTVANAIFHLLIDNIDYGVNQPDHPFNLYANPNISIDETIRRIRDDVMNNLVNENNFTRGLVRAFCSPGGVNREALEELLDIYYAFSLNVVNDD